MNTLEIVQYYSGLLILQYSGKDKAVGTIETTVTPVIMPQTSVYSMTFSVTPASGIILIRFGAGVGETVFASWNATAASIQSAIRLHTGFEDVTVTGAITSSEGLIFIMTGVDAPSYPIQLESSTFSPTSVITITETDLTLPLAVQDGFNLTGDNVAVGAQLDILGKYAGVKRTAAGFTSQITLDDSDFLSLIKMAIIQNSSGSSLATIQANIQQFFPNGEMLVIDYKNMHMSFLISQSVGSQDLVQLFITEGLLPKPMGVQASVIYAPTINSFFGFVTYESPTAANNVGFNTYEDYHMDWPFLDYADSIIP